MLCIPGCQSVKEPLRTAEGLSLPEKGAEKKNIAIYWKMCYNTYAYNQNYDIQEKIAAYEDELQQAIFVGFCNPDRNPRCPCGYIDPQPCIFRRGNAPQ